MTPDLARLDELHQKATPAPWDYDGMHNEIHGGEYHFLIVSECRSSPDQEYDSDQFGHHYDHNFALIAALRNDYPAIRDYVRELEAERTHLADVRRIWEWYRNPNPKKPPELAFTAGPEREIATQLWDWGKVCDALVVRLAKAEEIIKAVAEGRMFDEDESPDGYVYCPIQSAAQAYLDEGGFNG